MTYTCKIEDRPAQAVLAIRTRTAVQNLPQLLGQAYGTIMQHLMQLGEQPAGAPFVAYYNEDMQNLDIAIGFPVARKLPGQDTIQAGEMPAGRMATCLHVGPYDKVEPAYAALTQWIGEQGYQATGVAYEVYLNDPQQTPPEMLQTQILFPLKPKPAA